MLTQPMNPMMIDNTQMSQPGYDSGRNMYGQQNMAYQQGYNMQPNYNQQPNPNMRPQSTYCYIKTHPTTKATKWENRSSFQTTTSLHNSDCLKEIELLVRYLFAINPINPHSFILLSYTYFHNHIISLESIILLLSGLHLQIILTKSIY